MNDAAPVVLAPSRYVTLATFAVITGYSVKAANNKIDTGVWREGHEWFQAPDNRRLVDMLGYNRWACSRKR